MCLLLFFHHAGTPETYTLSLHDALPISAVPVRLRAFDAEHARLTLARALPLQVGDRIVLRAPGSRNVFAGLLVLDVEDRKSTRLNSSHVAISYAVCCLKKQRAHICRSNY